MRHALKDTNVANPFRNRRLLDLMKSLENKMGRAVAHKPKMLAEESLKAMLEEVRRTKCTRVDSKGSQMAAWSRQDDCGAYRWTWNRRRK